MKKRLNTGKKENKFNIPNLLGYLRIILGFFIAWMFFAGKPGWAVVLVFAIGALTDAFDGFIARNFNMKTEFGRKLDMIADRIFMATVIISFLAALYLNNLIYSIISLQILMIMSREIISFPFLIISKLSGRNMLPHARKVAKFTTLMQGITFSMIILGWGISFYFSIITMAAGIASGILYANDTMFSTRFNKNEK